MQLSNDTSKISTSPPYLVKNERSLGRAVGALLIKLNHSKSNFGLRTVPTIVIAHTFCASPDTRISYRECLLIQGYFCAV